MSDARATTDGDLEYWRDTVRSARATNTGTLLAATASMEALLARISADAARIRELEARQVPDGWQVVPKEPTEAMFANTVDPKTSLPRVLEFTTVDDLDKPFLMIRFAWRAMLAAAPRP